MFTVKLPHAKDYKLLSVVFFKFEIKLKLKIRSTLDDT